MNVLSLFDGMSCGRLALDRLGVKVNNYYASEIDKFAIQVSNDNWNDVTQIGDVNHVKQWYEDNGKPSIDLMLMGSPCQGFSNASQSKLNFEHPQSKLFFVAVEIMKLVKPKYFLLENVKMKKDWQDIITSYMGVEPTLINSSLVSAQNRERLYWTNLPNLQQPTDKGILLKDILDDEPFSETYPNYMGNKFHGTPRIERVKSIEDDKHFTLTASMYKGQIPTFIKKPLRVGTLKQNTKQVVNSDALIQVGYADDIKGHDILRRVYSVEGKAPTLNTCSGGNREPKILDVNATRERRTEEGKRLRKEHYKKYGKDHTPFRAKETVIKNNGKSNTLTTSQTNDSVIQIKTDQKFVYRKLTATECERLQTVPTNYSQSVSKTQRFRMLGNGWTIDVIAHILKPLLEDQKIVSIKPKEEK